MAASADQAKRLPVRLSKDREEAGILGKFRTGQKRPFEGFRQGGNKATELSQQLPHSKDAARLTLLRTVRKPHIHL